MAAEKRLKRRHSVAPSLPETRRFDLATDDVEIRRAGTADAPIFNVGGLATVIPSYDVYDAIHGSFEETMAPDVAAEVIARAVDCRLIVNHDSSGLPLARTASGTMRLFSTPSGTRFEAQLDGLSQLGNDVASALARRDLTGVSVGFTCGRESWDASLTKRTVHSFSDLPEISLCTFPASETTSVAIRSAMLAALPVESRARLRHLYAGARAGRLSDEEVGVFRSLLYAGLDDDQVPKEKPRRQVDPVVRARLQVEASRHHRTEELLRDVAKRQRRRPSA